jgi:hypothetical protein
VRWLGRVLRPAGAAADDADVGQPYLMDLPFAIDLVERDGWRFEITFAEDVAAREPERIAAFVRELDAANVGVIVAQDDGRTILTTGRVSTDRIEAAALRAWAAVGGRIEPPMTPPPDGRGR